MVKFIVKTSDKSVVDTQDVVVQCKQEIADLKRRFGDIIALASDRADRAEINDSKRRFNGLLTLALERVDKWERLLLKSNN
jgi:hypothetical protein